MRTINFYTTDSGKKPVEEFLDGLTSIQAQKVTWVTQLIEELPRPPIKFFKKLVNTSDIWEIRITLGNNIFRILGFFVTNSIFLVTNGFAKKTQKTPKSQIVLAEKYKRDYLMRYKL